jgi:hypothetical protein
MHPYISKSPNPRKQSPPSISKGQNVADFLILNDKMKLIMSKSKNQAFKPLKNPLLSKISDSPFGNFPFQSPKKKEREFNDNSSEKKIEKREESKKFSPKKFDEGKRILIQ